MSVVGGYFAVIWFVCQICCDGCCSQCRRVFCCGIGLSLSILFAVMGVVGRYFAVIYGLSLSILFAVMGVVGG